MSQRALWIRLNVDWSKSDWLIVLSAECRLVWIELLCYCKAYGNKRGSCPARSPLSFARMCFVGEEAVTQLLIAAKAAGAIVEQDGLWQITGWSDYQSPEAVRMAEHRAKDAPKMSVTNRNGDERYEFPVTRQQQQQQQQQGVSNETPKKTQDKEKPSDGVESRKQFDPLKVDLSRFQPSIAASWSEWVAHRKEIRKPLTERSVLAQLTELAECRDPVGVIRRAVAGGWQGLNIRPEDKAPPPQPKERTGLEIMRERERLNLEAYGG